jgi:3-(3-hydroxy-phenyl)propionate hydroxylase
MSSETFQANGLLHSLPKKHDARDIELPQLMNTVPSSALEASTTIDTDVLVIGLGPVGSALANFLGKFGVKAMIVDTSTEIFNKPRAISLDNEALRILQHAGLVDGEFDQVVIRQVQYHSPIFGRFARMNTSAVIDTHPALITFFQPQLDRLLRQKLTQYPCIDVALGVTFESAEEKSDHTLVQLKRENGSRFQVRCRYLVACDGANSQVRQSLGIPFAGRSYHQDWLIVDAKNVPNPIDYVEFTCDPKRPSPRMVAPGERQRWEFMLAPHETRQDMEKPENIRRLLEPWCGTADVEIERAAVYRFRALVANSFSKGRSFLMGDAAHVTPPFAGQGLVSGLRDAANLSWKLAHVLKDKAPESILATYSEERRPHAKQIINLAVFLGAVCMPRNIIAATLVHGMISAIRWIPGCRPLVDDVKIKPKNMFGSGLFKRAKGKEYFRAGAMLPQVMGRVAGETAWKRSDDVMGHQFTLVAINSDPFQHLPENLVKRWLSIGAQIWQWHDGNADAPSGKANILEIANSSLEAKLPSTGWLAVIRPDRCVMAEGPTDQAAQLLELSLAMLSPR